MKKMLFLLCILLIFASLCSCKYNEPTAEIYTPLETNISKDYVKDFMELLEGETKLDGLLYGYTLDEEHCYNVTPKEVAEETDMKIFKFSDSFISLILIDNEIYELCNSFGGYGFVNALPCDFDGDGNKDLLVASSWGSGMHRSIISVFNSVSKTSSVLYDTSNTNMPYKDLIVAKSTENVFGIENDDDDFLCYSVLSVTMNTADDNMAHLSYTIDSAEGYIEVKDNSPTFIPYQTSTFT